MIDACRLLQDVDQVNSLEKSMKKTSPLCYDVLTDYARHLTIIGDPSDGEGRIEVIC